VPEDGIQDITAVMTVLGGKPVYGDGEFNDLAPKLSAADAGLVADRFLRRLSEACATRYRDEICFGRRLRLRQRV